MMRQPRLIMLLILSTLLVGCGSTTTGHSAPTPTATIAPTAIPSPTSTTLTAVTPEQFRAACSISQPGAHIYQIGDLYVSVDLTNVDYPAAKLPDGVPQAPYKLAPGTDQFRGLPPTPKVNPNLNDSGFFVSVCNASKNANHRIEGVDVRIDRFIPFTGALNSWQFCAGWYANGHADGGGCGGGYQAGEYLHATFGANAGAGATTPASFIKSGPDLGDTPLPPLPLTRTPGQSVLMVVALTAPTAPGTYDFSFSLTVDGAKTAFAPLTDDLLLDSAARIWSGDACATPAMKAQIPSSSADSYICP